MHLHTPTNDRIAHIHELFEQCPHCIDIVTLIDAAMECDRGEVERLLGQLHTTYGIEDTDCEFMINRLIKSVYDNSVEARENDQARKCVHLEGYMVAHLMDALLSEKNRHGTREEFMCDDIVLNKHPEWLINHYHEHNGIAWAQKMFRPLFLE